MSSPRDVEAMSLYDDLLDSLASFKAAPHPEQEAEADSQNGSDAEIEDPIPLLANARDPESGRSVLHQACIDGDKELVKLLLQDPELNLSLRTMLGGLTALHLAVSSNHRAIVFQLLSNGADVLARDKFGCSPLHYVKSVSVAKLLVQYGGKMLDYNSKRKSTLDSVLLRQSTEADDIEDPAIAAGRQELLKYLQQVAQVEYKARLAKLRELKQQTRAQQEDMKDKRRLKKKSLKDTK